jgi:hypothetical protein
VTAKGEKRAYLLTIPWVRELTGKPTPCEGLKWGRIALKHVHSMGGRPPEGIPARARCKLTAHYRYTASRKRDDHGTTGNYCWAHVVQQINNDWHRYDEWRKSTGEAS